MGTPCPRSKTSARAAEAPAGDRRRPRPGPAARSEDTRPRASPSSPFVPGVAVPTARSPGSPLPRHIAGAGPGRGSGLRTCWPWSPPTSILPSRAARTRARPSPGPGWCARARGSALLGVRRRRGARRAHSAALCRQEARLGASPSKEKAAPGAEPRPRASPPPPRLRTTERVPGESWRGTPNGSCLGKARGNG